MSLEDIKQTKLEKLELLKKAGVDPYPAKSWRTHEIKQALDNFEKLSEEKERIVLVGRVMAKREHGASVFLDLQDESGQMQTYFKKDVLGERDYDLFSKTVDIGDFIEVSGFLFKTKKEEKTLEVEKYRILTKSLLPLPEKWHGLEDTEEKLRLRYVDLIMNPNERELFIKKSRFWQATRDFLLKEGGLEVETPILEKIPGGADAEPFKTHMNALDIDLYLRISPELNLKRLNVGGFEKVFEIGRIFRNEGIDREHLQDYTQVEMYWAYTDYKQLMAIVEKLIKFVVKETIGGYVHKWQDKTVDWSMPWQHIDYYDVFQKYTGLDLKNATEKELKKYAQEQNIDVEKHLGRGRLIDVIFKKKARPHLIEPGFLILPPVGIEPLAKRWPEDPDRVERFQVVACGSGLGEGFFALNDPLGQRHALE